MSEKLYKISQVAECLDLKPSAIRYYEAYGFIKPTFVDPETKYRFYAYEDVCKLSYILYLRNTGMTMKQVKQYLSSELSKVDFLKELKKKRLVLDNLIKLNQAKMSNKFEVFLKELPDLWCIKKQMKSKEIEPLIEEYWTSLMGILDQKIVLDNDLVSIMKFNNSLKNFNIIDAETYFICKNKNNNAEKLATKQYLSTFYKGSYENIETFYNKVKAFADKNKITLEDYTYEIYIESFLLHTNPENFLTEILFPIKSVESDCILKVLEEKNNSF